MTKEETIQEVGRPILRPLGFIQGVFILTFISSPFIWIWKDWEYAWKTGLTGLIGVLFIWQVDKLARKIIKKAVNENYEDFKQNKPICNFQKRLE